MKEKKEGKVQTCFSLSRPIVDKIGKISRESGMPKSQIVEKCFGSTEALKGFEDLCRTLGKKEKEGE